MRRTLCLICLAISLPLIAQDSLRPARFDHEVYWRGLEFRRLVYLRAQEIRPQRRDAPLRELNITDEEVREIQGVTRSYIPDSYVNISSVVTGCPCEEGPGCEDQVYVLADAGAKTVGLQLSRIEKVWKVGEVQKWWLANDRLYAQRDTMDPIEYHNASMKLAREFPVCSSGVDPAKSTAMSRRSESPR
jgi:hypothetical protein